MKRIREKKKTLPSDFYEVMLKHEIKLNSEIITIDIIRKLTFLYSVILN